MTLRQDLEELIRWEASASPYAQALYAAQGDPSKIPATTHADVVDFLLKTTKGLQKAILLLADEVDALR